MVNKTKVGKTTECKKQRTIITNLNFILSNKNKKNYFVIFSDILCDRNYPYLQIKLKRAKINFAYIVFT